MGGELRCKEKEGNGDRAKPALLVGEGGVRVPDRAPQASGPHGRPHGAAGRVPAVRGRYLPASPPLSRHLPYRPARRCGALPGSCGPLGPRPRPGRRAGIAAGAAGEREPRERRPATRAPGYLQAQVSRPGRGWGRETKRGQVKAQKGPWVGRERETEALETREGPSERVSACLPCWQIREKVRGVRPSWRGTRTCLLRG